MGVNIKDVVFVDIRDTWENRMKKLDNSILIPFNKIPYDLNNTLKNKNAPLVLFCSTGIRCKVAKDYMQDNGYNNIIAIGSVDDALKIKNNLVSI